MASISGVARKLLATMVCLALEACSTQQAQRPASSITLHAASLYEEINALPQSGPQSLAALFNSLGKMSFTQYYQYLLRGAPDAEVRIDEFNLGNPRAEVAANEFQFIAMGVAFPTVADWWHAVAFKPVAFTSEQDFTKALETALSGAATLGLDDEGTCQNSGWVQGQGPGRAVGRVNGATNGYSSRFGVTSHAQIRSRLAARQAQAGVQVAENLGVDNAADAGQSSSAGDTQSLPYGAVQPRSSQGQQIAAWRNAGASSDEIQRLLQIQYNPNHPDLSGASSASGASSSSGSNYDSLAGLFSCFSVSGNP